MESKIRLGIAGLGRSGWDIHVKALMEMPEQYQIVAVADAAGDRREEAKGKLLCRAYERFEDLFGDKDVELLIVATPSHLHSSMAIGGLRAGKDVVVEKPMALDVGAADEMIAATQGSGRVLTVFQNYRYAPDYRKVKEVVDSGILGRIVQIRITRNSFGRRWDWQTLKEFGGGMLNNVGTHIVDLGLQFLGEGDAQDVFADIRVALASGDAEDHVKVVLKGKGGPTIDVEMSSVCAYAQDAWGVMGTCGGLRGTSKELQWKWVDFSKMPARPVDRTPTANRSYNKEEYLWQEDSWRAPAGGSTTCDFYRDLYQSLRRGAALVVTPQSVRRQLALLERVRQLCSV